MPPIGGQYSYGDDQQRLNILAQNERKRIAREDLMLTSWTALHGALLYSAKQTCPLHYETLKSSCGMTVHNPNWGEFTDGPLAWRMTLYLLQGKPRTKKDRAATATALLSGPRLLIR